MDLGELVGVLRANPGMRNKAPIALVREVLGAGDWLGGPGDDGAVCRRSWPMTPSAPAWPRCWPT